MKHPEDQILNQLLESYDAAGKLSLKARTEENADFYDVIDFIQSQKLRVSPDQANLKQALLQASLIEASTKTDDWGAFMRIFKPAFGVSLSLLVVVIMVNDINFTPQPEPEPAALMMQTSRSMAPAQVKTQMSELESWQIDFKNEMSELEQTKAELESIYNESLFSGLPLNQS